MDHWDDNTVTVFQYDFSLVQSIVHMDEFIDDILREERVCDIMLPRIQVLP